ncbi:hypothetical protein SKAU_G00227410 [Synaphobranchus kaupii]|uniref:FAM124 domain-containing protein n=1 Tax=Synaphobranchus kaupii TaxID=118154 RepID=A0A9Q1IS10_SYNKA|nr:hypothetical protein SKAU_G00227410 [Synaphobranchus kaupii]
MVAVPPGLRPQAALLVVLFPPGSTLRPPWWWCYSCRRRRGTWERTHLRAHLSRPLWQYHHTESLLPYQPAGQDFYSLGGGRDLPLWAVRQVHYGHKALRYTLYCRHASFPLAVVLYAAILGREPAAERAGFVCFDLFRPRSGCKVQLALKCLPAGSHPSRLPSALLEFRVNNLRPLRPHLPHPCTPISALRWQTQDHDGNKILLQLLGFPLLQFDLPSLGGKPSPVLQ